jgi:hypothetical protein
MQRISIQVMARYYHNLINFTPNSITLNTEIYACTMISLYFKKIPIWNEQYKKRFQSETIHITDHKQYTINVCWMVLSRVVPALLLCCYCTPTALLCATIAHLLGSYRPSIGLLLAIYWPAIGHLLAFKALYLPIFRYSMTCL